jgi:hypothetical protein
MQALRQSLPDSGRVGLARFKRDLQYMRNGLGAPVSFDMEAGGVRSFSG